MDNTKYIKLFFGVISIIIAVLYVINIFNKTGLDLLFTKSFLGFLLLFDSIVIFYGALKLYVIRHKAIAIMASVILFILGIVPILVSYNLLNFTSSIATLTVNLGFMAAVIFFAGIYLVLSYF